MEAADAQECIIYRWQRRKCRCTAAHVEKRSEHLTAGGFWFVKHLYVTSSLHKDHCKLHAIQVRTFQGVRAKTKTLVSKKKKSKSKKKQKQKQNRWVKLKALSESCPRLNKVTCHILSFIFNIFTSGRFHITFPEHNIPLRVIKFSHIFLLFFLRWSALDVSSAWSKPLWQEPLLLGHVFFCCFFFFLAKQPPYSLLFILTSGRAAAARAIKQLIYLTWKLMITKDS